MYYFENIEVFNGVMQALYSQKELDLVSYSNLSDADKLIYIERAELFVDDIYTLPYKGSFVTQNQQHAFPRKLNTGFVVDKNDTRVLKAICCVFYDLLKVSVIGSRKDYIRQGITSIKTADVTENYGSMDSIEENEITRDYVKYLGFCLIDGIL